MTIWRLRRPRIIPSDVPVPKTARTVPRRVLVRPEEYFATEVRAGISFFRRSRRDTRARADKVRDDLDSVCGSKQRPSRSAWKMDLGYDSSSNGVTRRPEAPRESRRSAQTGGQGDLVCAAARAQEDRHDFSSRIWAIRRDLRSAMESALFARAYLATPSHRSWRKLRE